MSENLRKWGVMIALCLCSIWLGSIAHGSNLDTVDPYNPGGWYEVADEGDYLIRYNPRTGDSWVLACPTAAAKDCEWDPIEVREE